MPGIAIDSSDNIFVADTGNHTIRKIDAAGNVTTIAGKAGISGSTDGIGVAASFKSTAVVTAPVGAAGTCKFVAANAPTTINAPLGLVKAGSSLFFAAGNGVGLVSNVP